MPFIRGQSKSASLVLEQVLSYIGEERISRMDSVLVILDAKGFWMYILQSNLESQKTLVHPAFRGGPQNALLISNDIIHESNIGFFCFDVLLHQFCDHFVLVNDFLLYLLDPLLLEFIDLGFGHS